jgi:hypothetical protein
MCQSADAEDAQILPSVTREEHAIVQIPPRPGIAECGSLFLLVSGTLSMAQMTFRFSHGFCSVIGTAVTSVGGLLSPHAVTGAALLFALNNWRTSQDRERAHWLKRIQDVDALELQHAPYWIRANKEIVVAAVLRNPDAMKFVARELISNPVLLNALKLRISLKRKAQRSSRRSMLPTWLAWCSGC